MHVPPNPHQPLNGLCGSQPCPLDERVASINVAPQPWQYPVAANSDAPTFKPKSSGVNVRAGAGATRTGLVAALVDRRITTASG